MKIIKYAALAILVITLCKKTGYIHAMEIGLDGKIHESAGLTAWKNGWNNMQTPHVENGLLAHGIISESLMSEPFILDTTQLPTNTAGFYNPHTKTATVTFTNIVERSKENTPPSVDNPAMVPFGVLVNAEYNNDSTISGGRQTRITTLWGIPNTKEESNINNPDYNSQELSKDLQKYNKKTKTATMKDGKTYVGIIEYSKAVTPPNIAIPALQPFATIKNPAYSKSKSRTSGGHSQYITLWGLEVSGHHIPLKNSNSKTIGQFWPESNIAQLNNGQTIVLVSKEAQGNYRQHAHAMGPVWTWYQQPEYKMGLRKYGLTSTSSNDLSPLIDENGVGLVTINNQKYNLFGINISKINEVTTSSQKMAELIAAPQTTKKSAYQHLQHIEKETPMPGADSLLDSRLTTAQQTGLYSLHP